MVALALLAVDLLLRDDKMVLLWTTRSYAGREQVRLRYSQLLNLLLCIFFDEVCLVGSSLSADTSKTQRNTNSPSFYTFNCCFLFVCNMPFVPLGPPTAYTPPAHNISQIGCHTPVPQPFFCGQPCVAFTRVQEPRQRRSV